MENGHSKIEICTAQARDIPEWLTLVRTVEDDFPGLDIEDYAKTLQKNIARRTALCARIDGTVAGVLLFSPAQHCLSCIAVHPEYRRQGVASALISGMLRRMPDGDISVTTFREGDPKGRAPRALYRRFGFAPEELTTEFGYPVQRFILRRGRENDR